MKKIAIILTIVAATAMIFSSCGKYEEGPGFSLLTKKARITGTWTYKESTINGAVQPTPDYPVKYTLEKDGTGKFTITIGTLNISSDMEWEFNDTKEILKIRVKDDDGEQWDSWTESEIIRLTNSEMWIKNSDVEDGVTYVTITKLEKE